MNYVYMILRKEDSKSLGADIAPAGSPLYIGITAHKKRLSDLKRGRLTFDRSQIHVLFEHEDIEWCKAMEKALIATYGRKDLGTGILLNHTDGGDGTTRRAHTEESKKKTSRAVARDWIVTTPEGVELFVTNMSTFCTEHGLSPSLMSRVASGQRNHHKHYRCRRAA